MSELDDLEACLASSGFVAARDEAEELLDVADGDDVLLETMVERRLRGEPLSWITGFVLFCGVRVHVAPGVYVPRWQSEPLARRAATRLPHRGIAIDLCTGSGAVAKFLRSERSGARVLATDLDERAVACAVSNGVEAYHGDLFDALPQGLANTVDVIVGVVPYVPTSSLELLPSDTFVFESMLSYDGGTDGTDFLRRVITESTRYLRHGGALLLELGGDQAESLVPHLDDHGFVDVTVIIDDDGDVRGIEATLA